MKRSSRLLSGIETREMKKAKVLPTELIDLSSGSDTLKTRSVEFEILWRGHPSFHHNSAEAFYPNEEGEQNTRWIGDDYIDAQLR